MNLENIKEGDIFKKYTDLCEALGEKSRVGGRGRKFHLEDMQRFFRFQKTGHSFKIIEIFDEPLEKKENTRNKKYHLTDISEESLNYLISKEVPLDRITLHSETKLLWKCSECEDYFYNNGIRALSSDSCIKCPLCKKSSGERAIERFFIKNAIEYKTQITFSDLYGDKYPLRFDFGLYSQNVLKGLIEYDGAFHELDEGTMRYDTIKNQYCFNNNIALLRVTHQEENPIMRIVEFINSLGIENNIKILLNLEKYQDYDLEIKKLENEKKQIDNKIKILKKKQNKKQHMEVFKLDEHK